MNDLELAAYAKQKLTAVRRELTCSAPMPRRSWRSRTAHLLRDLADGLEPPSLTAQPPRLRA